MINLEIPGVIIRKANGASATARSSSDRVFESFGKILSPGQDVEAPEFRISELISRYRTTGCILHRDTFEHHPQFSHVAGGAWRMAIPVDIF